MTRPKDPKLPTDLESLFFLSRARLQAESSEAGLQPGDFFRQEGIEIPWPHVHALKFPGPEGEARFAAFLFGVTWAYLALLDRYGYRQQVADWVGILNLGLERAGYPLLELAGVEPCMPENGIPHALPSTAKAFLRDAESALGAIFRAVLFFLFDRNDLVAVFNAGWWLGFADGTLSNRPHEPNALAKKQESDRLRELDAAREDERYREHLRWLECFRRHKERHASLTLTEGAAKVKRELGLKESANTIRQVLGRLERDDPGAA